MAPTAQLMDFEWHRDLNGYRLSEPRPTTRGKPSRAAQFRMPSADFRKTIAGSAKEPWRIIRNGGRLVPYRPFEAFDSLCTTFAALARDAPGLLDFTQKFGSLTDAGLRVDSGEPIDPLLQSAASMRQLLAYASNRSARKSHNSLQGEISIGRITARFSFDQTTEKPRVRLSPATLLDALWI